MWLFGLATVLLVTVGAWCLRNVRRDYNNLHTLSSKTTVGAWLFYSLHFIITVTAAATSSWPLPIGSTTSRVAGITLSLFGFVLYIAGIASFRSLKRVSGRDTSKLVTTGIYRWSRNPQNLGWLLFLAGVSIIGRSGLALLMTIVFGVAFRILLPIEEKFLESVFENQYRDYLSWSHRYIGRPRGSDRGPERPAT